MRTIVVVVIHPKHRPGADRQVIAGRHRQRLAVGMRVKAGAGVPQECLVPRLLHLLVAQGKPRRHASTGHCSLSWREERCYTSPTAPP